jgi:hypothetical protein
MVVTRSKSKEVKAKKYKTKRQKLIYRKDVLDWCNPYSKYVRNLNREREETWGKSLLHQTTNHWTSKVGETLVKELLYELGEPPKLQQSRMYQANGRQLRPDIETDNSIYECKTRCYTISGTAGEKILGSAWKYSECYKNTKKVVYIVCIGYQEQEAEEKFNLFNPCTKAQRDIIKVFQRHNIRFIKFTDMLKKLNTNFV